MQLVFPLGHEDKATFNGVKIVIDTHFISLRTQITFYDIVETGVFDVRKISKRPGTNKAQISKPKVLHEHGWTSKQMISEGEAAIQLETTRCAFSNQEKSKQRSAIERTIYGTYRYPRYPLSRVRELF